MFTVMITHGSHFDQKDFFSCDKVSIGGIKPFPKDGDIEEFCGCSVGLLAENEEWLGEVECSTSDRVTVIDSNGNVIHEFTVPSYKERLELLALS